MTDGKDVYERQRIMSGTVDIGAAERATTLICDFAANKTEVLKNETVKFTSEIFGSNVSSVVYYWDFENDGEVDISGANKSAAEWQFATTGVFFVKLTVSNAVGETAQKVRNSYIEIFSVPLVCSFEMENEMPVVGIDENFTASVYGEDLAGKH